MKKTYRLAIIGAGMLTLGMAAPALAYHDGGVAACEGCHTMHNSWQGTAGSLNGASTAANSTEFSTGLMLLKGTDQSSTCLNCHGSSTSNHSYHVMTANEATNPSAVPQQEGPGGDFAWLQAGTALDSATTKEHRGHSIVAADFGLQATSVVTHSPGGNYPTTQFFCSSCHDPHGEWRRDANGTITTSNQTATANGGDAAATAPISGSGSYGAIPTSGNAVGVYRLLAGKGYEPKSLSMAGDGGNNIFTADAPVAVAPSNYNVLGSGYTVRVAYGTGMSEWCANCHANIHSNYNDGSGDMRHPASSTQTLGTAIANNYNHYVKSGDMTGTTATSYLSLVPFETAGAGAVPNTATINALTALTTSTAGPSASANVMCLSCHRAHASAFQAMLRWDMSVDGFDAENGQYDISDHGLTQAQVDRGYYDYPASNWATYQRVLCNKCHAKD